MADIADKVVQIRQAVYGKDVRESIASGIEAINTDAENAVNIANNAIPAMNQIKTDTQAIKDATQAIKDQIPVENATAEIIDARGGFDTLRHKLDSYVINVKDYGAKGDGATDDAAAIQAAVDYIINRGVGGTLHFPSGKYKIGTQINVNFDLNTPITANKGINIRGDNPNSTQLINATASDFIFNVDESFDDGRATNSFFHMQDIMLTGTLSNKGLSMHGISEQYIENVVFQGLLLGAYIEDIVRCRFVSCEWNGCQDGLVGSNQVTISTPNAIEFFGCYFYGNGKQPVYIYGGCNINFYGGTIESSGFNRGAENASGVRLINCGRYGGAICNFYGTYFEGNTNIADVWITVQDYPGTYNFHGCTFNKFGSPKDNTNNIYVENAGTNKAVVNITGCSFQDFGNSPSSDTKYIACIGDFIFLNEHGNYYESQLELPNKPTNNIYATGKFVNLSSTPALWNGYNVSSISKNAIGDYTITFTMPSVNDQKITVVNCGNGFATIDTETNTTIRIKTYDKAGTAFDPAYLMLICVTV